ncbi:BrnT family toxin [Thalassotalea sp. G20_0]|uniref:BrnT family toxin n=1 Tax=Thalassotalea sp. G20_0 TaxID=2821093 RepID=UPI001ADAFFEE|nr:BrnT family toxin [Thalassotalea sp. G20_0]MBO9496681.1 BrnT family toxin [Thalassotalea sp. G20_0]
MKHLTFEWDDDKSRSNLRKHGISFDEARTVFFDENGLLTGDPDHSEVVDRFILPGMSVSLKILVVCLCYRTDEVIRIFSARSATQKETDTCTSRMKP